MKQIIQLRSRTRRAEHLLVEALIRVEQFEQDLLPGANPFELRATVNICRETLDRAAQETRASFVLIDGARA